MGPPGLRCSACLLETPQLSSKPAPGPQMARNGRSSLPRSRSCLEMAARACPCAAECPKSAAQAWPGAAKCSRSAARACPGAAECSKSAALACSGATDGSKWPLEPAPEPQLARNGRSSLPLNRRMPEKCCSSLARSRTLAGRSSSLRSPREALDVRGLPWSSSMLEKCRSSPQP